MINFDQLKESIKESNDIVDVVNAYVPLKRMGTYFKALCPFHSEKTPSFSVNPTKQIFYCFGCQKGGDVIRFVIEHERVDFLGALRILARRAGIEFPESKELKKSEPKHVQGGTRKDLLYEIHENLTGWYQENLRSSSGQIPFNYLKRRGLSEDILWKFQLGYAPDSWRDTLNWGSTKGYSSEMMKQTGIIKLKDENDPITKAYDRFRDRLMFPIWNERGDVIAFSGRIHSQDARGAKYINSPETPIFTKGNILYGLHLAREGINQHGFVLLCEGQMDVIACHQTGFNNAVASLGTSFTEKQARLLKRYTDTVILLFDADEAGINAMIKSVAHLLTAELTPKVALLDEGEDPASIIQKSGLSTLETRVNHAEDYFIFRLNLEMRRHNIATPEGKEAVIVSVLKDISLVASIVRRAEYCRIISARVDIAESVLFQELNRIIKSRKRNKQLDKRFNPQLDLTNRLAATDTPLMCKAEAILLEIIIYHKTYALKLLEDLPHDFISGTATGKALNAALAHAEGDEWEDIEAVLIKNSQEYHSQEINKALFAPDYGLDADDKTVQKAYTDCLYRGIVLPKINEQMAHLQRKLKTCSSKETKAHIQREYLNLRKQKSEFHAKLEANQSLCLKNSSYT